MDHLCDSRTVTKRSSISSGAEERRHTRPSSGKICVQRFRFIFVVGTVLCSSCGRFVPYCSIFLPALHTLTMSQTHQQSFRQLRHTIFPFSCSAWRLNEWACGSFFGTWIWKFLNLLVGKQSQNKIFNDRT